MSHGDRWPSLWVENRCAGHFVCSNGVRVACGSSHSKPRTHCSCQPRPTGLPRESLLSEIREPIYNRSLRYPKDSLLSAAVSSRVTRVNVTAMYRLPLAGPHTITWHPQLSELPIVASDRTALFFVHSHRHHPAVFEAHAAVLSASLPHSWLVKASHALIFCNNPNIQVQHLLEVLRRYPSAVRLLIHTAVNVGYRCGLLQSLAVTRDLWARYPFLVVTHPDVYLFPKAISRLAELLTSAAQEQQGFVGTTAFVDLPHDPKATDCLQASKASGRNTCRTRVRGFLSDLFAVRPPELLSSIGSHRFRPWIFENMTRRCLGSWRREGALLPPEAALYDAMQAQGLAYRLFTGRHSGSRQHLFSASAGIMHTHNATAALDMLSSGCR